MTWNRKSESDTDVVWAELDDDGEETGNYRYESKDGVVWPPPPAIFEPYIEDVVTPDPLPETVFVAPLPDVVVPYPDKPDEPKHRTALWFIGAVALAACIEVIHQVIR